MTPSIGLVASDYTIYWPCSVRIYHLLAL